MRGGTFGDASLEPGVFPFLVITDLVQCSDSCPTWPIVLQLPNRLIRTYTQHPICWRFNTGEIIASSNYAETQKLRIADTFALLEIQFHQYPVNYSNVRSVSAYLSKTRPMSALPRILATRDKSLPLLSVRSFTLHEPKSKHTIS
jgi:hypothetical protein